MMGGWSSLREWGGKKKGGGRKEGGRTEGERKEAACRLDSLTGSKL